MNEGGHSTSFHGRNIRPTETQTRDTNGEGANPDRMPPTREIPSTQHLAVRLQRWTEHTAHNLPNSIQGTGETYEIHECVGAAVPHG